MRKIINLIVFQAAWFAVVLAAAHGYAWLGVLAVLAGLALHLALSPDRIPEFLTALSAAVIGFCIDSALITAGVFSPIPHVFPAPLSSLWMVMLWVNLATTLDLAMGWLRGRYVLAAIFGAIGGPLAYYSGAKLGAMTALPPVTSLIVIGAAWAVALPLLYRMAKLIHDRFSNN
jgi:hypothetical protein